MINDEKINDDSLNENSLNGEEKTNEESLKEEEKTNDESLKEPENTNENSLNGEEKTNEESLKEEEKTNDEEQPNSYNNMLFFCILIIVIISWILVDLWLVVIENLFYYTFGLNKNSTLHSLLVALIVTAIFITIIFLLGKDGEAIQKKMTGIEKSDIFKNNDII